MAKKPMSREFRKRLLRNAAVLFGGLGLVLVVLASLLQGKQFAVAALIVVPVATLSFNLMMRRAYAAEINGKR